jgi:hypothetical protein
MTDDEKQARIHELMLELININEGALVTVIINAEDHLKVLMAAAQDPLEIAKYMIETSMDRGRAMGPDGPLATAH